MSDERQAGARPGESGLAEVIDNAVRRLTTVMVISSAIIGLAIYSRPSPPRFSAFATPNGIVRVDERSGTIIACEAGHCTTVLRHGQRLERHLNLPTPARQAPTPTAAPVPAPTPAQLPAPAQRPAVAPAAPATR